MTYQQAVDYLFGQLPMFQRIGPAAYKANLDNTLALSDYFGNPEKSFPSIHIAGTNGKGSVAHMMASMLQEAGYKTGLATSPHLKDFRERIKIDGQCITQDYVTDFVNTNRDFFDPLKASFFEISIAMTFKYFSDEQVDIAVVETGLGGRLDSTNILMPEVSIITNIGFDHTLLLGDTLEKIAKEKAGIIKRNTPVVIGRMQHNLHPLFSDLARVQNAPLTVASELFTLQSSEQVSFMNKSFQKFSIARNDGVDFHILSDLTGNYQKENVITALAAMSVLNDKGRFCISNDAIQNGLKRSVENTGLLGRWQRIGEKPAIICDTAHNADGMGVVISQLLMQPYKVLRMVIGMVDDKDIGSILSLLPREGSYYFCKPDVPRGLDVNSLLMAAKEYGLAGVGFDTVSGAFAQAKNAASAEDLIFVGGSTFVVAEVL
jgi:dihydrofolate synthase / folylpolyglutamate synthase